MVVTLMQEEICWKRAHQLQEENVTVLGKVVAVNRGGIMVEVENLRGFIPTSHVSNVRSGVLSDHSCPQPAFRDCTPSACHASPSTERAVALWLWRSVIAILTR